MTWRARLAARRLARARLGLRAAMLYALRYNQPAFAAHARDLGDSFKPWATPEPTPAQPTTRPPQPPAVGTSWIVPDPFLERRPKS